MSIYHLNIVEFRNEVPTGVWDLFVKGLEKSARWTEDCVMADVSSTPAKTGTEMHVALATGTPEQDVSLVGFHPL